MSRRRGGRTGAEAVDGAGPVRDPGGPGLVVGAVYPDMRMVVVQWVEGRWLGLRLRSVEGWRSVWRWLERT